MSPAVLASEVERTFGEVTALDGVSIALEPGEVYGLIGPNGAGKTTLVRSLTGTTTLDAGTVEVLGAPPNAVDRERLGVLPQSFRPHERLTARELLAYYGGLYETARSPEAVLEAVGLAGRGDVRYEHLSGGQQRRLCVGTAIVNEPDVLFLDEPTTGIDPAGRRTVWGIIEDLAAGGTTVLVTTHDMDEATHLADRVGLLSGGRLLAEGPPAALVEEHGGDTRVAVETTASPDALEPAPWPVAGGEEGTVLVEGVPPAELGDLVAHLEAADVEYTGVTWSEPDLEAVYLTLAGGEEGSP